MLAGSAVAGGGATLLVAEKMGLSPVWAGVATGGAAMAGASLVKNPQMKDAFFGAGLGGMGVAGVQMLAGWYAKRKDAGAHGQAPSGKGGKRQADGMDFTLPQTGGYVTRQELNDTLAKLADKNADQHKQTCDLMTALHEEIKKVVAGEDEPAPQSRPQTSLPVRTQQQPGGVPHMYPLYPQSRGAALDDERNAFADDEYMRNAYGVDDERNAYVDDERNAYADDEYMRNAYGDDERNAYVDDERNAYVDDERNAYADDERNGDVDQYAQMTGGSSM